MEITDHRAWYALSGSDTRDINDLNYRCRTNASDKLLMIIALANALLSWKRSSERVSFVAYRESRMLARVSQTTEAGNVRLLSLLSWFLGAFLLTDLRRWEVLTVKLSLLKWMERSGSQAEIQVWASKITLSSFFLYCIYMFERRNETGFHTFF